LEACGGAHYWARELIALGHTVRLIPPQYVRPYVKRSKNDRNDAEAIILATFAVKPRGGRACMSSPRSPSRSKHRAWF
jgi:transposase